MLRFATGAFHIRHWTVLPIHVVEAYEAHALQLNTMIQ